MQHKNSIIVALDGISIKKALNIAKSLKGNVWGFKINDLLFEDPKIITSLKKYGGVFADAKLHDIPNTVAHSVERLSSLGADLITVHMSGGMEMLRTAKKVSGKSKIIGVTVLTSLLEKNTEHTVIKYAELALASGIDGIVCSTDELKILKKTNLLKIVPGIRPQWYTKKDDQKRIGTPGEAINLGANFIIIGRPITKSRNPFQTIKKILLELGNKTQK